MLCVGNSCRKLQTYGRVISAVCWEWLQTYGRVMSVVCREWLWKAADLWKGDECCV